MSLVRLGIDLDMFPPDARAVVDELFLTTQPGHLQQQHSEKLSTEERDHIRADVLRERLLKVPRPPMKG